MIRPIDANALIEEVNRGLFPQDMITTTAIYMACKWIENAPTIDAIPISFIEEQVKLCNEIGFRRGEECYVALIEKWREKNDTKTD